MDTTRRASLGLFIWAGLGGLSWLAGCGGAMSGQGDGRRLKANAKVIAWNFAMTDRKSKLMVLESWKGFIDLMDQYGFKFLDELQAKGYRVKSNVSMKEISTDPKSGAKGYDLKSEYFFLKKDAVLPDASDQTPQAKLLRMQMTAPFFPPPEIDKKAFEKGVAALVAIAIPFAQANMLSDLSNRVIFAFRVSKERIKAGKEEDFADPKRPQEETFADIDMALALNAESHAEFQLFRSRLLATVALICAFDAPTGLDELKAELKEQNAMITEWVKAHPEPNKEDFGVGMAELPSTDGLFKWLDENMGMATAIVQVGMGVASGSPQATLDGLQKLAPEDSSIKTILQGLSAASKGDIQGVIEATASLTGYADEVKSVKEKVASVKDRLGRVKNAMDSAGYKPPV